MIDSETEKLIPKILKDSIRKRCGESSTGRIIVPTDITRRIIQITNCTKYEAHSYAIELYIGLRR